MGGADGTVWLGDNLALARYGIGEVNAAAAALLIDRFGANPLVFSSVAGSLNPELVVGAAPLADRLDIHDYGVMSEGRLTPTRLGTSPWRAVAVGPERVHRTSE